MKFFASAFLLLVALPSVDAEVNSTPGAQEPTLYQMGSMLEELNSPDPELLLNAAGALWEITNNYQKWGAFMNSVDGEQCRKDGVHVGSTIDPMRGRLHLFCCLDCSSYATESGGLTILTMKGMRHLGNAPVDEDQQSLGAVSQGCINLQGHYEMTKTAGCFFHVDRGGVHGGSLSSFSPSGGESYEALTAEDGCTQKLSEKNYELICFCPPENATDCEYSKGYHDLVIKHQNRLMLEAAKQNGKETSALHFFHQNENGKRKVHCAYEWNNGIFDGFYSRKNLRREDLPPPSSSCGLKVTFNALDYEKSIYNMTIDMGSFTECDENINARYLYRSNMWVPVQPTCPIHVSENDDIAFLHCCRDSDACNHVDNVLSYRRIFDMTENYTKFGFHFPWAHACGDTVWPFQQLFSRPVSCYYFYDVQKRRIVKLFDGNPVQTYGDTVQQFEGTTFSCFRMTALISKHDSCPSQFHYYDEWDPPMRDYIVCRDGENHPKLSDMALNTLFAQAMEEADFRCMKEEMVLDKYLSRVGVVQNLTLTTQSSNYSACFTKLSIYEDSSNFKIISGAVSEDDESIFDFYADHFVSQRLVDGIALALNVTERSATLICSGSSECNSNEGLLELLLALFHLNTVDSDFLRPMVCGRKECPDYSGCYHLRTYGDETTEEEGCIADIKPEDEHLSVCLGKFFKRSEHSCKDLRILKDGIPKFYRVCCHSYGGPKFLEDLDKPFTWPLHYE